MIEMTETPTVDSAEIARPMVSGEAPCSAILSSINIEIDGAKERKIVATLDGVLCGAVRVEYAEKRSACIMQLFVSPSYRRQGIGRQLINECCAVAIESGCESVGLMLKKDNPAQEFYLRMGFVFGYQYDDGDFLMVKTFRK